MDVWLTDWIMGRDVTGALNRVFAFRAEGIEFFLGAAAFILLCFSMHMLIRSVRRPALPRRLRGPGEFSSAAEKLRRAYAVFAWAFMSLSFVFSILFYMP